MVSIGSCSTFQIVLYALEILQMPTVLGLRLTGLGLGGVRDDVVRGLGVEEGGIEHVVELNGLAGWVGFICRFEVGEHLLERRASSAQE